MQIHTALALCNTFQMQITLSTVEMKPRKGTDIRLSLCRINSFRYSDTQHIGVGCSILATHFFIHTKRKQYFFMPLMFLDKVIILLDSNNTLCHYKKQRAMTMPVMSQISLHLGWQRHAFPKEWEGIQPSYSLPFFLLFCLSQYQQSSVTLNAPVLLFLLTYANIVSEDGVNDLEAGGNYKY